MEKEKEDYQKLKEDDSKKTHLDIPIKIAYCQLIFISICFLLILGAFNPISNIISKIYDDIGFSGLG